VLIVSTAPRGGTLVDPRCAHVGANGAPTSSGTDRRPAAFCSPSCRSAAQP